MTETGMAVTPPIGLSGSASLPAQFNATSRRLGSSGIFTVPAGGVGQFSYFGVRAAATRIINLAVVQQLNTSGGAIGPLTAWAFPDPGLATIPNVATLFDVSGTVLNAGAIPRLLSTYFAGTVGAIAPPFAGAIRIDYMLQSLANNTRTNLLTTIGYWYPPGWMIAYFSETANQALTNITVDVNQFADAPLVHE